MVGKLWILTSSSSLAVESILATTMFSLPLYFSPSSSQMGASCLQCPHQGASEVNPNKLHCTKIWSHVHVKWALIKEYVFTISRQYLLEQSSPKLFGYQTVDHNGVSAVDPNYLSLDCRNSCCVAHHATNTV